jgi:hypothetical protein
MPFCAFQTHPLALDVRSCKRPTHPSVCGVERRTTKATRADECANLHPAEDLGLYASYAHKRVLRFSGNDPPGQLYCHVFHTSCTEG